MDMFRILELIYCLTLCFAEEMYFKLEQGFNNQIRFANNLLGPLHTDVRQMECATICMSTPGCALYRIRKGEETCQLYTDASSSISEGEDQGASYYSSPRYTGCLSSTGYTYLSTSRMCVKFSTVNRNYSEALADCQSQGGRTVVMEDEDKANDVLTWVTAIGRFTWNVYVGAIQAPGQPANTFIWEDGRPVTRGWMPGEPNYATENCVMLRDGELADIVCSRTHRYICELVI